MVEPRVVSEQERGDGRIHNDGQDGVGSAKVVRSERHHLPMATHFTNARPDGTAEPQRLVFPRVDGAIILINGRSHHKGRRVGDLRYFDGGDGFSIRTRLVGDAHGDRRVTGEIFRRLVPQPVEGPVDGVDAAPQCK